MFMYILGMGDSHLAFLYKKHLEEQEAEEKLCKWTDAGALQAYEQDLLNNGGKTVTQLLDNWKNPVFAAPEKVRKWNFNYTCIGTSGALTIHMRYWPALFGQHGWISAKFYFAVLWPKTNATLDSQLHTCFDAIP